MRRAIGRIGKPHGLQGWATVRPTTDLPEIRFAPGAVVFESESGPQSWEVAESSESGGRWLIRLDGIRDRQGAEAVRGTWLWCDVDPEEMPGDPDELFDHQLVGLRVRSAGQEVGEVREVLHLPGQDLLVVAVGGQDRLVPFVKELVPEVHVHAGWLAVRDVEGLLDDAGDEAL